ncbi:MAG: hypothetical protein NZ750_11730 [Anaerolineae bacterium]|nr:hypothetical protein [Anaerolineae bacterium]MDW8173969.1 hypothetical protein [Anaerolineae bacterium]
MTLHSDDTQPRRPANWMSAGQPADPRYSGAPHTPASYHFDGEEAGGPGCLVWGLVLVFCTALAFGIVGVAGFAGWTDGLRVGQANATATRSGDISAQCERIPGDLASGSLGLAALRLNDLAQATPGVPCVALFAPTATALHLQNLATATFTPSPTSLEQPSPTLVLPNAPTELPSPTLTPTSTSGFNLDALLQEAQAQIANGQLRDAIDTLSAINAIDPNYQKASVDLLMAQALTSEARRLYRSGQNLAEAILLTNRAEEYGSVGDLNYERFIASLYLEAQSYRKTNDRLAIQLLSRIVYEQNLPNYMGGAVMTQLFESYVGYGDLLSLGDPCSAVTQYDQALRMRRDDSVQAKRNQASLVCNGLSSTPTAPTLDPNALPPPTRDPNAPTPAFAPIGQPGS